MPTVPKTSSADIVRAARQMVAKDGLTMLSLAAVAQAVGVRAPSLYKRFADRAALVRAVALEVVGDLARLAEAAAVTGSATEDLRAIAHAQRAYAHKWPRLERLVFSNDPAAELRAEAYPRTVTTLRERVAMLVGPRDALPAARMLVAFTHGFLSMEIAGAFRLGGDLDEAFAFAVDRLLASLSDGKKPRRR